ncbi:toxin-antitoxin system YwqK family antitoxin [Roseivirga sp. BDSF3-8]|uniref:toxin-antitoxin system YwqK family antitoxin n=1 Tax=Roseivirga sp. BDSF3-8 TaxID=3241598 RepID=UPI003531B782
MRSLLLCANPSFLKVWLMVCLCMLLTAWQNEAGAQFKKPKKRKKAEPAPLTTDVNSDSVVYVEEGVTIPLTLNLGNKDEEEEEEEEEDDKKKKKKRNFYFGKKTKKAFTKSGYGDKITYEIFHVLKEPVKPDEYVRDFFWIDYKERKIKNSKSFDAQRGAILHGPYEKRIGDQVVQRGYFINGLRHGRWMSFTRSDILVDKMTFRKGWGEESEMDFYDREATKLKEVIPVEYGEKEGNYFYFHDNGQVAVQGEYQYGRKVGTWTEYFKFRRRRKKQIEYGDNPYNEDFIPYVVREWNEDGKLIYERKEDPNDSE